MNYGDKELVTPFLKVDSDSGKVSTSMDIDREKYDVSNYFEVSLALHDLVANSSILAYSCRNLVSHLKIWTLIFD